MKSAAARPCRPGGPSGKPADDGDQLARFHGRLPLAAGERLKLSEKEQNNQHDEDQTQASAGVIAESRTVPPRGQQADHEEDENHNQQRARGSLHKHFLFIFKTPGFIAVRHAPPAWDGVSCLAPLIAVAPREQNPQQ